jgi:hypothetical protein
MFPSRQVYHFIARPKLVREINGNFEKARKRPSEPPVVILLGMGGSGETQLALAYCQAGKVNQTFNAIFWVGASNPITLAQSYALISENIHGRKQDFTDSKEMILSVVRNIESWTCSWLMMFDNFDRPSIFQETGNFMREYWPDSGRGAALFISRHGDTILLGSVAVFKMEEDEAIDLLQI